MQGRANLAVAIMAIRELLEDTLRSGHVDAGVARALRLGLQGMGALWDALVSEEEGHDAYERDCADFFDSVPQPCVITDVNGIVRRANAAAAELFGVPVAALRRRPLDPGILSLPVKGLLRGACPARLQRGAEVVYLEVTVREMGRQRGRITGLGWLLRRVPASVQVYEQEKQPAQHGDVAEQVDARQVALVRVALQPEAVEDAGRRDGEHDQAERAEPPMPVEHH